MKIYQYFKRVVKTTELLNYFYYYYCFEVNRLGLGYLFAGLR